MKLLLSNSEDDDIYYLDLKTKYIFYYSSIRKKSHLLNSLDKVYINNYQLNLFKHNLISDNLLKLFFTEFKESL